MTTLTALLPDPTGTIARQCLDLTFTAITPVYLHGHDPTIVSQQEASVRGALHRWLWMLLGGLTQNGGRLTPKQVAEAEARIFGTTTWSPHLAIEVTGLNATAKPVTSTGVNHQRYIYVGKGMSNKDAWLPGMTFTVRFDLGPAVAREPISSEARALAACCWCWATLGWLGARGRRGFGALRLTAVAGQLAEDFANLCGQNVDQVWIPPTTVADWSPFLTRGLNGALQAVAALVPGATAPTVDATDAVTAPPPPSPPEWSALAPGYWRLLLIEYRLDDPVEPVWANALAAISERFQTNVDPERQQMVDAGRAARDEIKQALADPRRAGTPPHQRSRIRKEVELRDGQFGLPRQYRDHPPTMFLTPAHKESHRRPSPVIARPVMIDPSGEKMAVVWLAMRAVFLPGHVPVQLRAGFDLRDAEIRVLAPDAELPLIRDFMNSLDDDATKVKTHADLSS